MHGDETSPLAKARASPRVASAHANVVSVRPPALSVLESVVFDTPSPPVERGCRFGLENPRFVPYSWVAGHGLPMSWKPIPGLLTIPLMSVIAPAPDV